MCAFHINCAILCISVLPSLAVVTNNTFIGRFSIIEDIIIIIVKVWLGVEKGTMIVILGYNYLS